MNIGDEGMVEYWEEGMKEYRVGMDGGIQGRKGWWSIEEKGMG